MKFGLATSVMALTMSVEAAQVRILDNSLPCGTNCANDFSSLGGSVIYDYNSGTGIGTFTYTGASGNVVLRDEDLLPNNDTPNPPDGQKGYNISSLHFSPFVNGFSTDYSFSFSFNTNLLAGANGGFQTTHTTAPNDNQLNIDGAVVTTNGGNLVSTTNGVGLAGDLVTSGIVEFGYQDDGLEAGQSGSAVIIDLLSILDDSQSLISDIVTPNSYAYSIVTTTLDSESLSGFDRNTVWYLQDWTGSATVNTIVPIPAAAWLFISAVGTLLSIKKIKIMA